MFGGKKIYLTLEFLKITTQIFINNKKFSESKKKKFTFMYLFYVGKLKQGMTLDRIFNDVRNSLSTRPFGRMHLFKKKDLHNIAREFNIISYNKLHKNDATSIHSSPIRNSSPEGSPIRNSSPESSPIRNLSPKSSPKRNLSSKCSPNLLQNKSLLREKMNVLHALINNEETVFNDKTFHNLNFLLDTCINTLKKNQKTATNKKRVKQGRFSSTKKPRIKKEILDEQTSNIFIEYM